MLAFPAAEMHPGELLAHSQHLTSCAMQFFDFPLASSMWIIIETTI